MKETQQQIKLPGVPLAKQGREVQARWAWTEASVWTERMLATLERGITGGKWFSLIDKVWRMENLESAARKVAQGKSRKKTDGKRCLQYWERRQAKLPLLQEKLRKGEYQPQPVQRVWIPKGGSKELRPLGISVVEDRVVEMAVKNVIEPIFEKTFAEHSYAFRPERGAKDALRRVQQLLNEGKHWIVDADVKGYFDGIPRDKMMGKVAEQVSDGKMLELIEKFLNKGVMETGKGWQPTENGTPQGAVISPLLANIYLNSLDHLMAGQGMEMVRYADDFVVLCENEEKAQEGLRLIQDWMKEAGLTLHPTKTKIVNATEYGGFDFLGYHFERGYRWPRKKSIDKLKDTIRSKTKRTRSGSLDQIIDEANNTLRGWGRYFQHSIKNVLDGLDGYVRGRIRAILRKRNKRNGRARGIDHQKWPNSFFAIRGLISLATMRVQAANAARAH